MSSWTNTKKILSRKVPGILGVSASSSCPFTNPDAQTYWNALTAANGGVQVNGSLYGITTCALATAIDDWFNNIQALGVYGTFKAVYPHIGGTLATHAINAVNPGTFDLSFTAAPTCNANGTVFNGATQYADTGLIPSIDLTLNDDQITAYTIAQATPGIGSYVWMGVRDGISVGNNRIELNLSSLGTLTGTMYRTAPAGCAVTSRISLLGAPVNDFYILSRDTNASMNLWRAGASVGSVLGVCCGNHVPFSVYIGAMNTAGAASNFSRGTMGFNAIGSSINGGNAASYTSITMALMTSLGR